MIQIKNRPTALQTFQSSRVETLKNNLRVKVLNGETLTNNDINDTVWKTEEVRNALIMSQHRKCCFCENKRAKKREFDGEHFRPKLGVTGELDHIGYWWLAYEWRNIFYACKTCNQEYKKNQFPIKGNRAFKETDSLEQEQPLLVHPEKDNPEEFIGFDWQQSYGKFVKATGLDNENRGNTTIKVLGLNNSHLLEERSENVILLQDASDLMKRYIDNNNQPMVERCADKIEQLTSAKKRFAGFNRVFFRAMGLEEYISND